jgi:phospholipid/cholesterol/gamma-HCH transport system substrate-binding protein
MAFKVSNETKVGALTAITITLFILGFNFLKGKSPLKKSTYLYARFNSIEGLVPANPVIMNGLSIGKVYETVPGDAELNNVLVTIRLTEDILIPDNSVASVKSNPLGTPAIEIVKGDSKTFLEKGDTIISASTPGFLGSIFDKLGPTQQILNKALGGLDTLVGKVNSTINPAMQQDLRQTIAHLNAVSANLGKTVEAVNQLIASQTGTLSNTLKNLESFSGGLAESKDKIPAITGNLEKTTKNLSELDLDKTISQLNVAVASLQSTLEKLNNDTGTLGALINDRKMYDNLTATTNSLNLLLQDLRLHPKRYVNVSVFGKKDKSEPLMRPMSEDSITQEQIPNPPKQ